MKNSNKNEGALAAVKQRLGRLLKPRKDVLNAVSALGPALPAEEGALIADTPSPLPAPAADKTADKTADKAAEKKERLPRWEPEPDRPFHEHHFRKEIELIDKPLPVVLISAQAYQHMCLYVEIASKEVGWMGSVSRTESGDFLIEETFLLDQQVHATETELASEDIGKLTMALIDSGSDGLEKANKLRFWGHSHVHMGTSPSGTDERTMERFGREQMPWYVRGIFNKYGRAEFTLYLFDRGLRINDAAWAVWDVAKARRITPLRQRSASLTSLLTGNPDPEGPKFAPLASELVPSPELRAQVEAEFKDKVKERIQLWSWIGFGLGQKEEGKPDSTPAPQVVPEPKTKNEPN